MRKYYIIAYDASSNKVGFEQIGNFIKYCNQFHRWWNNLPLIWVVESDLTANEIRAVIKDTMNGASFIVAAIDPWNLDGLMPRYAWDWFYPEQRPNLLMAPQATLDDGTKR